MKQTNFFKMLLAGALLVALTSCADINPVENQSEQAGKGTRTENIGLQLEPGTKVTLSNGTTPTFAWEIDDEIAVWAATADNADGAFRTGSVIDVSGDKMLSVGIPEGQKRFHYAVYPSSVSPAYNVGSGALTITLPNSYFLSEVQDTRTPLPMIAANADGNALVFYNLGGMLRLTVHTIPPTAKRLEIDFDGKKVCGEFTIASPVTPNSSVIATTADDSHDVITITKDGTDVTLNNDAWLDGLVLNIPLPTGTYSKVTVTAYDALSGGTAVFTQARSFSYTASRKNATKRTIPAVFTVNDSKLVVFSPGNLQASTSENGAHWTWGFADNQYTKIGNATANNKINGNGTVSTNGTVDSFGYSTAANYYGISNSTDESDYSGDFVDWGTLCTFSYRGVSTTYPSDFWRSLTANSNNDVNCDWRLLRDNRTTRATVNGTPNARYTEAKVNTDGASVNGIILFPDDFDGITPEGVSWGTINGTSAWGTQCTTAGWAALELAGCVFLPVTDGRRLGNNSWWNTSDGWYRPRIIGNNIGVTFGSGSFSRNQTMGKQYGMAVRLVHQVN